MKKSILALVLVIALICAASVPAYAFNGSVTLEGPSVVKVSDDNVEVCDDIAAFENASAPALVIIFSEDADESTPSLVEVCEKVADLESIEDIAKALELNAEELGITSDYALADFAYVAANDALVETVGKGNIAATVEVPGIAADSEILTVMMPFGPEAADVTVACNTNADDTFTFTYMDNGIYLFLVKA